jgi:hypothetical protein
MGDRGFKPSVPSSAVLDVYSGVYNADGVFIPRFGIAPPLSNFSMWTGASAGVSAASTPPPREPKEHEHEAWHPDRGYLTNHELGDVTDDKTMTDFHIGQSYDDDPAVTIFCKQCLGDSFLVGFGHCLTVIKCKECGWESAVHDG